MHKLRGFTLIELLLVIAIIALLMGLLMSAYGPKPAEFNSKTGPSG